MINLGQVKRIVDIENVAAESASSFALYYNPQFEETEKLFAFSLVDACDKSDFIKKTAEQMSITQMRADSENLISLMPASELNLDVISENSNSTFSKTISKVAKKTSMKVSQALTGSAGKSSTLTKEPMNPRVSQVMNSVTPIRSASRGFLFTKKLVSNVDLSSATVFDDNNATLEPRKRTLPDRTSTMAESSLSLSRNNFG